MSNQVSNQASPKRFLEEDFATASGTTPPAGWTNLLFAGAPAVDVWRFDNPGDRPLAKPLRDPAAVFDSDALSNNNSPEDVALVSPVFDVSGATTAFLQFDQIYEAAGSQVFVEVTNDGINWQEVYSAIGSTPNPDFQAIDISSIVAGQDDAQIRFRYTGDWSFYWFVDNVVVSEARLPSVRITETVGSTQLSAGGVNDTLNVVLTAPPTAPVTIRFTTDPSKIAPVDALTFTPDNWETVQTVTLTAVADGITDEEIISPIQISVSSEDANYDGFALDDIPVTLVAQGIPGFPSYRTVEETYSDLSKLALENRAIAAWIDIGDTYDKVTPGGPEGYDIYALKLTNSNTNPVGGKPVLYMQGALHARELTTAELVTRFAEQLVAGYGSDPDITWLLDYNEIHLVPIANPDGRKFAEQGFSWRKNTNPTSTNPPDYPEPAPFPTYGVDLNRNYSFEWNNARLADGTFAPGASSGNPAAISYRGVAPFSEPESQALRDYVTSLFPNSSGPKRISGDPTAAVYQPEYEAVPDDTAGIYLDIHSFGNLVLYPWGWYQNLIAPNNDDLRTLGRKYGYFTAQVDEPFDVIRAEQLYPADGATDDWAYGNFGVATYTLELGNQFFEPSEYFESTIVPENLPALLYMAKAARRPYQTPAGPESLDVTLDLPQVVAGTPVTLTTTADDTRFGFRERTPDDGVTDRPYDPVSDVEEPIQPIAGGRYSIGEPSWIPGVTTLDLTAADGTLDSPRETLAAKIDTTGLSSGRYTVFVESQDAAGNWGVPSAVFLDVLAAPENANFIYGSHRPDQLRGSFGNDVIYGFKGDDQIMAGGGADTILAGADADQVAGESGDDLLYGEDGDDVLDGGNNEDVLYGEAGNDLLRGGFGRDIFVLAAGKGTDSIADFRVGRDQIGLQGLSYEQLTVRQGNGRAAIAFGDEILATLSLVNPQPLTAAAFVPV